ncbi:MAG: hypothetical protein RR283_12650, partial [Comamonas sp.]
MDTSLQHGQENFCWDASMPLSAWPDACPFAGLTIAQRSISGGGKDYRVKYMGYGEEHRPQKESLSAKTK